MTLYLFYKNIKKYESETDKMFLISTETCELYAYTNNKKLAKEFINQRDASVIIAYKKHIDKSDYKQLLKEQPLKELVIIELSNKNNSIINIIGPEIEFHYVRNIIDSGYILNNLGRYIEIDPTILTNDYIIALKNLLYHKLYCDFHLIKRYYDIKIKYNEFEVYLSLFADLYDYNWYNDL